MSLIDRYRPHLPWLAALALLAPLLTWPLVLRLGSAFPSGDPWFGGDPHTFIWWIDWAAKAIAGTLPAPAGEMTYWPQGINPWSGYDGLLLLICGVPLVWLVGNPVFAMNLLLLGAFVAAAWSAYALAWRLTRQAPTAGLAGLLFGYSTYLLVRATQHPNLCLIFVVPLLLIAVVDFGESPSWRRAAKLGAACLLVALSSSYYAAGAIVTLAVMSAFFGRRLLANWRPALGGLTLAAFGLALPNLPMLLARSGGLQPYDVEFVRNLGLQPLNLILPHPFTNVFGNLTAAAYARFPNVFWDGPNLFETSAYLGVLTLALAATWFWRRREAVVAHGGFVAAVGLTALVLAMGTELNLGFARLPLPFAALRHFFPFTVVRSPNRLFVFALIAASVLAAAVAVWLVARLRSRFRRAVAIAVLLLIVFAERLIVPYPLFTPETPEFYRQIARDSETYAIADLPIMYPGFSEYDFYQITHGKPIVDGEFFYPAYGQATFDFIRGNALLDASVCRGARPNPDATFDRAAALAALRDANVRYVVVHHALLRDTPSCAAPARVLRQFFDGIEPRFVDGRISAYEVTDILTATPFGP